MPNILPFKAIHYPWTSDFSLLTAPPYDVIGPEELEALRGRHPHNIIRVSVGGDYANASPAKYEGAARALQEWLEAGVLTRDPEPLFFIYGMEKSAGDKRSRTLGLLGALELAPFGEGGIFPHERTIPGPIQDRLELMRTTSANLEPLWFFASAKLGGYRSLMESVLESPSLAEAVDGEGVAHRLWSVSRAEAKEVVESLTETPLVMADGHHRYETALAYQAERRAADGPGPWDATLALIVDPADYPPVLAPIHRIVQGVSVDDLSNLTPFEGDLPALMKAVEERGAGVMGVASAGGTWTIATGAQIDTVFLNDRILEPSGAQVKYEHDPKELAAAVREGAVVFVMAATPIDLVAEKALNGGRMPPKTTLFLPKPRTGFVMRDLRQETDPG